MTVWHWVRHGPTHEKAFVGWRDVPADLTDIERIDRLRRHLPQSSYVISSDLIRASATADVLQHPTHVRLQSDPALREFNFGVWDGMHHSEVSERDPDLSRAFWETPGQVRAPEGESWNMAAARVNRCVDRLNDAHPDAEIIAVAHIGVILTQIQRALGVSPYAALGHGIDNLSCTRITWTRGRPRIGEINHCP